MRSSQRKSAPSLRFAYWRCVSAPAAPRPTGPRPSLPEIHPDPETFVRLQLGLDPDPKQAWILNHRHERLLVNCSRQWGKSTIAAAAALHRALMQPESTVVVLCPVLRQSAIFIGLVRRFVAKLGIRPRGDGENRPSILLSNGSRIVGLPGRSGDSIRGFSGIVMLIVDEAARLSDSVFFSAYPMVSKSGADIWALSTPVGKKGFFYNYWTHGGPEWHRLSAPATECPRIPAAELERARRTMGDDWVRQEYLCEFIDVDGAIFSRDSIDAAFSPEVPVLGGPEWN